MYSLRKKPEKPPPPPKPKWLMYGMVGFVALMAIQVVRTPRPAGEPHPALAPIEQALPEAALYQTALPTSANIKIRDTQSGGNAVVLCGQEVSATLTAGEHTTPITFTTGSTDHTLLTQLLSAMRVGGIRDVAFSKALAGEEIAAALQGEIAALRIEVISAAPDKTGLFAEHRLMMELIDSTLGTGATARCGDEVHARIALYGSDGALKIDAPATFTIGKGEVMLGIEQGAIGMREGGERTLVLPPAWQPRMNTQAATSLPKDLQPLTTASPGVVVVKITLLPASS